MSSTHGVPLKFAVNDNFRKCILVNTFKLNLLRFINVFD